MDAVIKVGGSLAETPEALKALCVELSRLAKTHSIVVVPGGGKFADSAREYEKNFNLTAILAHKLAILAMDQYGMLLSELIPNYCTIDELDEAKHFSKLGNVPIILPSKLMFKDDVLEASWDVTSDSIATYIAEKLNAEKVILVTDVDGIFDKNPQKHIKKAQLLTEISATDLLKRTGRTSVDRFLPKLLLKNYLPCYVVNGKFPERVRAVLLGYSTVCTLIKT